MAKKKVYVLELVGDPQNSGGAVTFEIAGISLDRTVIEALKVKKDKWLDDYLGDKRFDESTRYAKTEDEDEELEYPDEDEEDEDEEGEYTLYNTDLSSRPEWVITEKELL